MPQNARPSPAQLHLNDCMHSLAEVFFVCRLFLQLHFVCRMSLPPEPVPMPVGLLGHDAMPFPFLSITPCRLPDWLRPLRGLPGCLHIAPAAPRSARRRCLQTAAAGPLSCALCSQERAITLHPLSAAQQQG